MKTFADLNLTTSLHNALIDMGYEVPTPIQEQAFPVIMAGKDVVGVAQTGTGKTFAYLLPILRQLKFSKQTTPRILIIVPTRELVLQVVTEIEKLTNYMTVRTVGAYGGTNIKTQKKAIAPGVDIIVATPGRLLDLIYTRVLRMKDLKTLVLDEMDELLNLGFRSQLLTLLDLLPKRRQNLLFSATLTHEVNELINSFCDRPQKIEVAVTGTPLENITQSVYHVPNFYTKINLLEKLLANDEVLNKVLVFAKNKRLADKLHEEMSNRFPDQIGVIHSNKSQNYRIISVKKFQRGTHRVLIATDIIARGLDVEGVSHVFNFHIPDISENYMHRIGRTGRAERKGIAIGFVSKTEIPFLEKIETLMKQKVEVVPLPDDIIIASDLLEEEKPKMGGDKNYLPTTKKATKGTFHEKKLKNTKVNRANEKRLARKVEKKKAKRKKRK